MHALEVIIETPKTSHFKYKYNEKKEWFEVGKALPAGLGFPYDFGFIPGTKAEDGDPIDVLIFSEFTFLQGTLLTCNILGAIKAEQRSKKIITRNDRILAVPEVEGMSAIYKSINDISKEVLKEIENFFVYYNKMEDKEFRSLGILTAKQSWEIIKKKQL
jgi:inorganic pyrophosphatase